MSKTPSTRQIAVSIETTGVDPADGHRVIEIAAVELIDRQLTGRTFYTLVNPKRDIDIGALAVHGITEESLAIEPEFGEIAPEFADFVKGADLLVHGASFHVKFLNEEFRLLKRDCLENLCPNIIDTLQIAKKLRPNRKNSLGNLRKVLGLQFDDEDLFGSVLAANLVARIYIETSTKFLH